MNMTYTKINSISRKLIWSLIQYIKKEDAKKRDLKLSSRPIEHSCIKLGYIVPNNS